MTADRRRLRNRFVDAPGSVGDRARIRRWEQFQHVFPEIGQMRVIDLGGRASTWMRAPIRPERVHLVNLEEPAETLPDWITAEVADVTRPDYQPPADEYDLVFSNSVIEHVGGYLQRVRFARAVESLAPRHWVQTPYRYFPVEPHYLFPGFQFLPLAARAVLLPRWPMVHSRPRTREQGLSIALSVELLSRTEMRHLFPGSSVLTERIFGLTKSLIIVRTHGTSGDQPLSAISQEPAVM